MGGKAGAKPGGRVGGGAGRGQLRTPSRAVIAGAMVEDREGSDAPGGAPPVHLHEEVAAALSGFGEVLLGRVAVPGADVSLSTLVDAHWQQLCVLPWRQWPSDSVFAKVRRGAPAWL